jgi:hypothetical protein
MLYQNVYCLTLEDKTGKLSKMSIFSYKSTIHKSSEERRTQLHCQGIPIPREPNIIYTRISVRNDGKQGEKRKGQEVKKNKEGKDVERFTDWMNGVSE